MLLDFIIEIYSIIYGNRFPNPLKATLFRDDDTRRQVIQFS